MADKGAFADQGRVFGYHELLFRCGGDAGLAARLVTAFRARLRDEIDNMAGPLAREDFRSLGELAHRLKGTAANLAATSLREAAAALEDACATGNVALAPHYVEKLRIEAGRFEEAAAGAMTRSEAA